MALIFRVVVSHPIYLSIFSFLAKPKSENENQKFKRGCTLFD